MNKFHNQSVSDADTDDLLSGVEPLDNMTFSSFHSSPKTSPQGHGSDRDVGLKYSTLEQIANTDHSNKDVLYPSSISHHRNFDHLKSYGTKDFNSLPVTPYEEYKDFSREVNKRYAASVDQMKSVLPDTQLQSRNLRENLLTRFNESKVFDKDVPGKQPLKSDTDDDDVGAKDDQPLDDDPNRASPQSFADSILKSAYNSNMSASELEALAIKKSPPHSNKKASDSKVSEFHGQKQRDVESDTMSDSDNYQVSNFDRKSHSRSLTMDFETEKVKSRSPEDKRARSLSSQIHTEKSPRSLTMDFQYQKRKSSSPKSRHTRSYTSRPGTERSPNAGYPLTRRAVSDIGQIHGDHPDDDWMSHKYNQSGGSLHQRGDTASLVTLPGQRLAEPDFYDDKHTMRTSGGSNYTSSKTASHRHSPSSYLRSKDKNIEMGVIEDMESVRGHLQSMLKNNAQYGRLTDDKLMDVSPSLMSRPRNDDSIESISTLIEGHLKGLPGMSQPPELGSRSGVGGGGVTKADSLPSGLSKIDNTLFSENTTLRESLEKERTRRKHCEHSIQTLQTKLLESQQQLAVAVSTEKKKDVMIEQLDKTLAKVVEGWKKREAEREQVAAKVEEEKREIEDKFTKELSDLRQQMSGLDDELSQEKQKALRAVDEKEAEIKLHETERDRLSELVETERERVKRTESERDRAVKGRDHVTRQLEALQKTLNDERTHWQEREHELTDLLDEARESQHQLVVREKDKLDEQQRINRDTQEALDGARKEIQRLQLDLDSVAREKDHLKMECSLIEARVENTRQKLEAELRAEFEKQTSQKLADSQKQMSEYESEIRESHRHQVNELTQKHAEDVRSVQEHWRTLVQQKEAAFADKMNMFEERLKEARTEITQLKVDKQKLEIQRNDITKRLQSMMQAHCNEALSLLVGAKGQKESSLSVGTANSTLVSGIEPINTSTNDFVEKYLKSYQHQESQPASSQRLGGHVSRQEPDLPSLTPSVVGQVPSSRSVHASHQPFHLPPNVDYTSSGQVYKLQPVSDSVQGRSVPRMFDAGLTVDQPGAAYSMYSGSGSSESMVTARQGMSSIDVKGVSSSTEVADNFVTPAVSQDNMSLPVHFPPFSTYSQIRPSGSAYAVTSLASTQPSKQETRTTPARELFPSSYNIHATTGEVNRQVLPSKSVSYGNYSRHVPDGITDVSAMTGTTAVDHKEEDDNISVISSLLNEPSKLDYREMTDRLNTFEDRQKELQHYIKKLLDKSPGEARDQSSTQPHRPDVQLNQGLPNQGVLFTPPVKQVSRLNTSVTLPRTVSEPPAAFMNDRAPHNTSAGIRQVGHPRPAAPSTTQTSKPRAFVKSTVAPPCGSGSVTDRNTKNTHGTTSARPGGLTSQQVNDIKSLLSSYGNPGVENVPSVEDLVSYLQSIQGSQSVTDPAASQVPPEGSLRLPGRHTTKTSKTRSPQSQKSSPPPSSRRSPRHGPVSKVKNSGSVVKDKKPVSARGKPVPVWK